MKKLTQFKQINQNIKALIDQFPENQTADILVDKWSLKDIVAHLNNWLVHDIDCLTALKEGREPYWEPDVDTFNAQGIVKRKAQSWQQIYTEFVTLGNNLVSIYETLPNNLWNKPIWKNKKEQTAHKFLDEDILHWEEHLDEIQEKTVKSK